MREIKFRYVYQQKNGFNKGQIYLYDFCIEEIEGNFDRYFDDIGLSFSSFEKFNEYQEEEGCELIDRLQYTGLKDKNGREIYDGDVLALKTHWDDVVIGFVVFKYGAFCLSSKNFGYDGELILKLDVEFEIISNVYESPELLEENND